MEVICSSERSVDFHRATWRFIPEDSDLHNHRSENLKSYKDFLFADNHVLVVFVKENLQRAIYKFFNIINEPNMNMFTSETKLLELTAQ
jgi:hypothetical protein